MSRSSYNEAEDDRITGSKIASRQKEENGGSLKKCMDAFRIMKAHPTDYT